MVVSLKSLARLLAPALTTALLLSATACGGSDDEKKSTETAAPSYPKIEARPATGTSLKGTGYTYKLPDGWQDITSQLKATQPGIDSGGRSTPPTDPFTANLNTLTTPNQIQSTKPTTSELKQVAAEIKSEIQPLSPDIKLLSPVSVAGVPTLHQEGPARNSGTKFYIEQYWLITPGSSFGFTFAFPTSTSDSARTEVVDSVLASVDLAS